MVYMRACNDSNLLLKSLEQSALLRHLCHIRIIEQPIAKALIELFLFCFIADEKTSVGHFRFYFPSLKTQQNNYPWQNQDRK